MSLRRCPQVFPRRLVRPIVCCGLSAHTAFLNLVVDGNVELGGRLKAFLSLLSFPFTFYFGLFNPGLFESFGWNENEIWVNFFFLQGWNTPL